MCRYIVHTHFKLSLKNQEAIEECFEELAINILGSLEGDVEFQWPNERLGRGTPVITIDAEFTVGSEEGDVLPDRDLHSRFAGVVLSYLIYSSLFKEIKTGGSVATWVRPDEGKSVYISYKRS